MNIETSVPKIKAEIKSIGTARQKLVDRIQMAALAVTLHAHVHGDTSLLNGLADAVGNGMKATALKLWLLDYAPVALAEKDAKSEGAFRFSKSKRLDGEELAKNMEQAASKPWYDYKTEKDVDEFADVSALLKALVRKLDKSKIKPEQSELASRVKALVEG